MHFRRLARGIVFTGLMGSLAACGGGWTGGLFGGSGKTDSDTLSARERNQSQTRALDRVYTKDEYGDEKGGPTIWDLFTNNTDPNITVEVNKYLWNASLEVLNFLPIETVDPFTGVIVTGYGTPPGGGRAYRATVYIQDPALDARSLRVSLQTKGGGGVSPETARAVEDAILTRARQLRIRDSKL